MSAPILRRGAAVMVATAIAGAAGVALAGPTAATPALKGQRVIVIVERGHEFCRFGHRTVVVIVKKDHGRVIIIRKIVRCDFRRHHEFFRHNVFFFQNEFRPIHRFNIGNNRVHVILPKAPPHVTITAPHVTTSTTPPQMSEQTGPAQISVQPNLVRPSVNLTSPSSLGNLVPDRMNVSGAIDVSPGNNSIGAGIGAGLGGGLGAGLGAGGGGGASFGGGAGGGAGFGAGGGAGFGAGGGAGFGGGAGGGMSAH
ncbi:hypothetical protein ABZ746_36335 [Streptomyces sp. NPDC020096]